MSTPTRRRRQSPAVYRRRRLALFLLVVVAAAVVWLLVAQPWKGSAATTPTPSTSPSATSPVVSAAPTPGDTPTAVGPETEEDATAAENATAPPPKSLPSCAAGEVKVEALADQTSYAADQTPQFSIQLTNTSGEDCAINVGTTTQSFIVTSGTDTYWRSTDCQTDPSDMIVTLTAGQSVTSATPVAWDRTRSSVDSCGDTSRPKAPGGGASYHLAVAIGGVSSIQTAQFQLY